jgi:hypothetical protein
MEPHVHVYDAGATQAGDAQAGDVLDALAHATVKQARLPIVQPGHPPVTAISLSLIDVFTSFPPVAHAQVSVTSASLPACLYAFMWQINTAAAFVGRLNAAIDHFGARLGRSSVDDCGISLHGNIKSGKLVQGCRYAALHPKNSAPTG